MLVRFDVTIAAAGPTEGLLKDLGVGHNQIAYVDLASVNFANDFSVSGGITTDAVQFITAGDVVGNVTFNSIKLTPQEVTSYGIVPSWPPFRLPLFSASLKSSLIPETATGSGTPTFTRSTVATVTDFEGLVKTVLSGEARFIGARRVRNLLSGNTSTTLPASTTVVSGNKYRMHFAGTGTIGLTGAATDSLAGDAGNRSCFDLITAATTTLTHSVSSGTCTDFMLEDVTGQSNQNPSEYVSVGVLSAPYHGANVDGVKYFTTKNGNTVAANVVTEATGADIGASDYFADASGPFGYMAESARTNLQTRSQDFTFWANTNCTVTTPAVTAPDGAASVNAVNVATAANALVALSNAPLVVSGTAYVGSMFVKAGAWNFVQLAASGSLGGVDYANYNLSTGAIGNTNMAVGAYGIVAYPNGWYRIWVTETATATAGGSFFLCCMPTDVASRAPSVPRNGELTTYVWAGQLEAGSFLSSYIPTVASTVTRNADALAYSNTGNIVDATGTAFAELRTFWTTVPTGDEFTAIARTYSGRILHRPSSSGALGISSDIGGSSSNVNGATSMNNAIVGMASTWGAELIAYAGVTPDPTPGTYNGDLGDFGIGVGARGNGSNQWNGTLRNVKIYDQELNEEQLAILI